MKNEPDIVKELRAREKNSFYYSPIEPENDAGLRKFFTLIIVLLVITAVIMGIIASNFGGVDEKYITAKNRFIETWIIESNYNHYHNSETFWEFFDNNSIKIINFDYYNYDYYNYNKPSIRFNCDKINNSLTVKSYLPYNIDNQDISWGKWKFDFNEIKIKKNYYSSYKSYKYSFSNNDSTLELDRTGYYNDKTLTKSNFSAVYSGKWENINITVKGLNDFNYSSIMLDRSSKGYYGSNCPSEWGNILIGDKITFLSKETNFYAEIKYIPSNEIIDTIYFYDFTYDASEGCVAYWDFDNQTKYMLFDKSGNENHGSIYGSSWVNGISKKALEFDGINDYVAVPDSDTLRPDDVTLILWLYPEESNPNSCWFVGKGCRDIWHNQDACSYGIDCDDLDDDGTVEIHTVLEKNDNKKTMVNYTIPTLNKWYHVAMSFNSSTQVVKLYVDGICRGSAKHCQDLRYNNPWDFTIAASHVGTGSGINRWEKCKVDEIYVYNKVLNSAEIKKMYDIG